MAKQNKIETSVLIFKKNGTVPVEVKSEKGNPFIPFWTTEPLQQMQKCTGLNIYRFIKNFQNNDNNSEIKLNPWLHGWNKF